jgi:type IV pilus assembly protein PilY1
VIQQIGDKARFGLMEFKGAGDGGKVLADVGSGLTSMVNAIENTVAATWTPLGESLYEATRYFAQIPPAYTNSDYSYNVQNKDPYYYTSPWSDTPQYVKCCKSFVMIFTDGQPTQDLNIPSTIMDKAHTAAAHAPVGFVGHCPGAAGCTVDHNSAPHTGHGGGLTNHDGQIDHHDNCSAYYGGTASSNDVCWSNGSHYLDDVAYYAHTTDLRQGSIPGINLDGSAASGKDIPGVQNLIVYTFYAFGNGSRLLQDAAKMGGFEDRNSNLVFDSGDMWDQYNNYSGGLGADGVPDTYFESSNADDMRDRFVAAINSILRRSQSGTSISVLATSGTGEGALYQSFFYPSTAEPATNRIYAGTLGG